MKQVFNSFLSTLGRILAYLFIAIVIVLLFNKCDVHAEMLPDFDKMTLGEVNYCTRLGGTTAITIGCYSSAYSTVGHHDGVALDGECIKDEVEYVTISNFITIDNEKLTYFTVNVDEINPTEFTGTQTIDRVYPGNWYAIDLYLTAWDNLTTFDVPTSEIQRYAGYTIYRYFAPYDIGPKSIQLQSKIDTSFRNLYLADSTAYTHLYIMFRLPEDVPSKTQLPNYITFPIKSSNNSVTSVSLLGYRVQYVGDTQNALTFVTDNHDHRYTDDSEFIYFDTCSGSNPANPDDPINPGVSDEPNLLDKFVSGIMDGLKRLIIPDNLDFIYNFVDVLENKLGFIGTIPAKMITFGIDLVKNTWNNKVMLKLPRVKIMGYYFWPDATIDLNQGFSWVEGIKYATDILCVIYCIYGINKHFHNFV